MSGAGARFVGDLRAAVAVWRRSPWLPLGDAAFVLSGYGIGVALTGDTQTAAAGAMMNVEWLPVGLVWLWLWAGWLGTERLLYLASWADLTVTPAAVLRATWRYSPRFVAAGLLATLAVTAVMLPVALAVGNGREAGAAGTALGLVGGLMLEIGMTFVTPTLAYTETRATRGIVRGLQMLRARWREAVWHVLVPPVVLLAASAISPNRTGGLVLGLLWALLALAARGAIAAEWLRAGVIDPDALGDRELARQGGWPKPRQRTRDPKQARREVDAKITRLVDGDLDADEARAWAGGYLQAHHIVDDPVAEVGLRLLTDAPELDAQRFDQRLRDYRREFHLA